jgi:hypothetical protein
MRYLYGYEYGLQSEKEKDSFRVGNNWDRCHGILAMLPQGKCPSCLKREEIRKDCYLCDGRGILSTDLMDAVMRFLNYKYKTVPEGKTAEQWEVERIQILYSLSGYRWYFGVESKFEVITTQFKFDLPVLNPKNHRALPQIRNVGKIDELIRDKETGLVYILERKSTNRDVADVKYWDRLRKDEQISSYLYSIRICQRLGQLECYGIGKDDPLIEGIYYDVWHKPSINPKFLTQADSKAFVESGEYCGEKFSVLYHGGDQYGPHGESACTINGFPAISNPGKKEGTFAIYETPEMYGARLLSDIAERPEFYFSQRPIARVQNQLDRFEENLARYAEVIRHFQKKDLWFENDRSCDVPFRCDFKSFCGQPIGPTDIPEGFTKYERDNSSRTR